MSKYHERIAVLAAVKPDWTTTDGITAGVRSELQLKGYGTEFQVWRDKIPIDEDAARQAIANEVTTSPVVEVYQRNIQKTMLEDGEFFGSYGVTVEAEGTELIFEHGGFKHPVSLGELELVVGQKEVEKRRKNRTKTEEKAEARGLKLREKLDGTQATDETDYLVHASQCGYLVGNTTMRFYMTGRGQWGVSMMTRINGIALPKLQGFIDSAGNETLSGVSTHADTSLAPIDESEGGGVLAMHSDFAKEIVDFLNLEFEVDIDGLKAQHRETDSKFQPIGRWGGDRETVLARLIDRRRDLNPADITEAFELGYVGELLD